VQVLAQFSLSMVQELSSTALQEEGGNRLADLAQTAVRSAARHLHSYLLTLEESFLDIFAEELEQHDGLAVDIREVSSSVRCLLPAAMSTPGQGVPDSWNMPAPHAERQHAAKAVRCLLIIRQLQKELSSSAKSSSPADGQGDSRAEGASEQTPAQPEASGGYGADAGEQPVPRPLPLTEEEQLLVMAEEVADGYVEGRSYELGRQDRIVCGVVNTEGRHTRYLCLHPFLLILVQPDLMTPGLGVVRTVCPIRQVEPMIDRSDPRTLRLGIKLAKGASCPGEAMAYDPSGTEGGLRPPVEDNKFGSFFMLTLSFEDVKRCLCADQHVRLRRQEVRTEVKARVEAFIQRLSA